MVSPAQLLFISVVVLLCVKFVHGSDQVLEFHKLAAAEGFSRSEMQDLLDSGVNVQSLTRDGESALHLACINGNVGKIKYLLQKGCSANRRANKLATSLHMTPLTWCIYGGHTAAVKAMLADKDTDLNLVVQQEDGGYITATDIATKIGDMGEEIRRLLRAADGQTFEQLKRKHHFVVGSIPGMPH